MEHKTVTTDRFIFGDKVQNIYASNDNPHKNGIFVKQFRRTGKSNPGIISEVTDGRGKFWEAETCNLIRIL